MDKDGIKKINKFVRLVCFLWGCVFSCLFAFVAFKECKGWFYTDGGLIGVAVLGVCLAHNAFKMCKDFYYEKRLEEEIEKEEE